MKGKEKTERFKFVFDWHQFGRRYYKNLWAKCKKLWLNKFIHGFWTSNGSIRLKLTETGNVRVITHDADLEELFPGNELISDDTR